MQRPKNLGLKLLSLFFALVLSYFVNSEGGASVSIYTFPIEFQNIPEKRVMLNASAKQVDVTVSGPSFIISKLLSESRSLKVRFPEGVGTRYVFAVDVSELKLPPTVSILSIEPREIEVFFDDKITRDISVVVPSIGSVGQNFRLSELIITPNQVSVTGPRSEVDALTRVETFPIDLRGVTSSMNEELRIRNFGSKVSLSPPFVKVAVQVKPVEHERRFVKVPIALRSLKDESLAVSPSVATILVKGSAELVQKITQDKIVLYVQVPEDYNPSTKIPVIAEVPEGISVSLIEPEAVTLSQVSKKKGGGEKGKRK